MNTTKIFRPSCDALFFGAICLAVPPFAIYLGFSHLITQTPLYMGHAFSPGIRVAPTSELWALTLAPIYPFYQGILIFLTYFNSKIIVSQDRIVARNLFGKVRFDAVCQKLSH